MAIKLEHYTDAIAVPSNNGPEANAPAVRLSRRDFEQVQAALARPPRVNARLRQAMTKRRGSEHTGRATASA